GRFDAGEAESLPRSREDARERRNGAAAPVVVASNGVAREGNRPLLPLPGIEPKASRNRRNWIIRLGGLVLLLVALGAVGSGRVPGLPDLPGLDRQENVTPTRESAATLDQPATPTPTKVVTPTPTVTPLTGSRPSLTPPPSETAIAIGVGGEDPTVTRTPTEE